MAKTDRVSNKHDVEIARLHARRDIGTIVAYGGVVAGCIAAAALPIWAIHGIIQPLAGKRTVVNANIVISVSLALTVMVSGFQYLKGLSRKAEIRRLRRANQDLLDRLGVGEKEGR